MPYTDPRETTSPRRSKHQVGINKKDCIRCKRARWLLTILILATMSVILYLNQFAQ